MNSSQPAPSGSVLPFFLRKKWETENETKPGSTDPENLRSPEHKIEDDQYRHITRTENSRVMHRVFTAREIESRMEHISRHVLVDIQKQIHRGEEEYYEETNSHGNLFRGWDAFVDAKDIGSANAASVPQSTRRIPADFRWFASSCKSISRPSRSPAAQSKNPPLSRPSGGLSSVPSRPPSSTDSLNTIAATSKEPISSIPEKGISLKAESSQGPTKMELESETEAVENTTTQQTETTEVKAALTDKEGKVDKIDVVDSGCGVKRKRQEDKPGEIDDDGDDDGPGSDKNKGTASSDRVEKASTDNAKTEPATIFNDLKVEDVKATQKDIPEGKDKVVKKAEDEKGVNEKSEDIEDESQDIEIKPTKKDDKAKKEEPQKRRSSRNKKTT